MPSMLSESFLDFFRDLGCTPRHQWRVIAPVFRSQLQFTAWEALGLVVCSGMVLGFVAWIQVLSLLGDLGIESPLCGVFVRGIIREIAPLFTGFLILMRSGTAIATELANMQVHHEWDALAVHGVSPSRYILLPRALAAGLSSFVLAIAFVWAAILGGWGASLLGFRSILDQLLEAFHNSMTHMDLLLFLLKTVCNGLLVPLVAYACAQSAFSFADVPRCTTRTVMTTAFGILAFDLVLLFLVPL